jgi:hypothetical protein
MSEPKDDFKNVRTFTDNLEEFYNYAQSHNATQICFERDGSMRWIVCNLGGSKWLAFEDPLFNINQVRKIVENELGGAKGFHVNDSWNCRSKSQKEQTVFSRLCMLY